VGRTIDVLVEGAHEETDLIVKGRHQGQAPDIDGNVLLVDGTPQVNTIQQVRIVKAHAYDLIGEVEAGGLESSTAAYEAAVRARSGA